MTLEQQVCSLELAKRLKELGVKQDQSLFWWTGSDGYYEIKTTPWAMGNGINISQQIGETYSAFTVAELGELMHENWKTFKMKNWKWFYKQTGDKESRMYGPYKTEAEARAICIIKRLEKMEQFRALSTKSLLA